jgi:hypothetical protein
MANFSFRVPLGRALFSLGIGGAIASCGSATQAPEQSPADAASNELACASGEVYCAACSGGGFCTQRVCPAVACPAADGGGSPADGGPCAPGQVSCLDCSGAPFCVPGACPAATCPGGDAATNALPRLDAGPNACVQAGGECGCTCSLGYQSSRSLSPSCPQPCPTCGACSGNCCLPVAPDSGGDADASNGSAADAGPIPCGASTCDAGQICVVPCAGFGPPPPPHCDPWPAACAGALTCGCLPSDVCSNGGMCDAASSISGRSVVCFGCA